MKVLIIGGGGLVGQKVARKLAERGTLRGEKIDTMVLADIVDPQPVEAGFTVETTACDIADPASLAATIDDKTDVIYLLAAIVSAQAEEDLDIGLKVNMMGTLNVLQRCRQLGTKPVLVFTSSVAVNGGEVDQPYNDQTLLNPQTSYGAQKAIGGTAGERLFAARSGGRARLPPADHLGASGQAQPRGLWLHVVDLPRAAAGRDGELPRGRRLQPLLPQPAQMRREPDQGRRDPRRKAGQEPLHDDAGSGLDDSPDDRRHDGGRGPEAAERITWNKQPELDAILAGWRMDIRADKAEALGLEADASFEDNIRYFLEDDIAK